MEALGLPAEQLASAVGARPFLLLALLVTGTVGVLLGLVAVARLSGRHARALWALAVRAYAAVAAHPVTRRLSARFPLVARVLRELSAAEYLVIHLGLGLALSMAALVFVWLAEGVREGEPIVGVDLALARALHASSSSAGVAALRAFTLLGTFWALALLAVVVAAALLRRGRRVLAVGWLSALAGGGLLNTALKALFARPRPTFADPLAVAAGWSFPSGHSMGTFVAFGMLSYLGLLFLRTLRARLALVALALGWTVAMGFSRMYLGVHYLSDVLAGFAAGTVWLAVCISGIEVARRRPARIDGQSLPA
ncbi:phosphatase PAP2 family protein [Sorangium atrum]|uniref:Phosphatase PAP2 family protein n=1 Tax=Sorangium atrum TaxID=2995308 RepID=A0ABT5C1T4_9BACT|nr:phosphatase PAP2 family protein [Sorangium aterium]MDC0679724.1 phosphatase PAP2 family protein [Sorangium aterium]